MKVFDRDWFAKHQRVLVWLISTWFGRFIFRYRKMGHYPTNRIVGISPNSITEFVKFKKGGRVELRQHFFTRNEYARKLYFVLLPMWYAMHAWDIFIANNLAPRLSFGFDTLTQYPGSLGSNNPDDGRMVNDTRPSGATWASIIAGVGTDIASSVGGSNSSCPLDIETETTTNIWTWLTRFIASFDTSGLGSTVTISAVMFSVYGAGAKADGLVATPNLDVYLATPGNSAVLDASDFQQVGSISQTGNPVTWANLNSAGYTDFPFNIFTGINKTGITSLGLRNANYDVAAAVPPWVSGGQSYFNVYLAYSGSNKPKLVVTYTLPSTAKNIPTLLMMGVG